ncbi:thiamine pyrophosphokinase [Fusobacterium necrophorum DAB]|uniref:Thiamine diphosphokinase n=1 Tax=Fusobacterium necrophorum BL TaxID=1441732 RepID=A0AB73BUI7_9FUSO|nr:thiamine diphosphokinase [Fusobacterium necrophorum]KDE62092.1 thiamine pyrophosphokinase [Fusobacterium necrophorum BL]KDE70621.1 thiamine pyrophosphokinase [Fusobacterium necrophorum DAB]KDE74188.1 thiamine pyrophosphokinase [Fusobacterium necrophorum BFTR-2]MCF0162567.1 thiamine diphosphokinase [Fusobacterium necrophorum]
MKRAYLILNGELRGSLPFYQQLFQKVKGDILCVDGGSRHLQSLHILPKELWGDLDSTPPSLHEKWEKQGCEIFKFPVEKDFTDFELLLQSLQKRSYEEWIVIGGLGGDTDHLLSNLQLCILYPKLQFLSEEESIFLLPKHYVFQSLQEHKISFIPFSEKVTALSLEGFQYNLSAHTLRRGETLCHGNTILKEKASVHFEEGLLLAVLKNKKTLSQKE